ncbi:M1-specific T cell receptor beta chain-like [Cyprinodon tularosa]|uniref:M1-specific T cell receptor beta chain-like n=1 Tax=Cyprinodon tularosa TaxID=77115 RepID=UPI0018E2696A|nr:M1-specific T cell receptor beta chain-like [Cyprinodon tularosa]
MILIFCATFHVMLVSGFSLNDQVHQDPPELFCMTEDKPRINCKHEIQDYNRILWYKQSKDRRMQFLGYMNVKDGYPENGVKVTITGKATKGETCTLTLEGVDLSSSGVYFCAATYQGVNLNPAYFGRGTKLTVLEDGRKPTPPTVKIFPPSPNECRYKDKPDWKIRKTLVCVASGFYPDHVSVSWKLNDEDVTDEVATDPAAKWDKNKKYYNITSRLRVLAKYWFKPEIKFSCIVHFYNGEKNTTHPASISGNEKANIMTREKYLKITQNAKVSYSVLIVKSCVYGALVCFLVWKLQSSSRKRSK